MHLISTYFKLLLFVPIIKATVINDENNKLVKIPKYIRRL